MLAAEHGREVMLDHPPNADPTPEECLPATTDDELAEHFRVSVEVIRALEEDDREELRIIRRFARQGLCKPK